MLSDLDDMRLFVEVVKLGSITRAARVLGLPKSSASRRIQQMEAHLRVQLLKRTTRRLQPTEIGQAFFERCLHILEEVALTEQMIGEETHTARGKLRIAIPSTIGVPYFSRWITDFLEQHPAVSVEIETGAGERLVDLVAGNFDVWVKIGPVPDSGFTLRQLGALTRSVYASRRYLARHPEPQEPDDLLAHNCLSVSDQPYHREPWHLSFGRINRQVDVQGNTWVNNLGMLRLLTLSGLGIAILPDVYAHQDLLAGELVRLLPDWSAHALPFNLVMPARELLPARTRLFVDFVAGKVHEMLLVGR